MEPSNKVKSILYSNFTTDALQYGIESEPKAVNLYITEMRKNGIDVKVEEVGLLVSKEKPFLGASIDRIVTVKAEPRWVLEFALLTGRINKRIPRSSR